MEEIQSFVNGIMQLNLIVQLFVINDTLQKILRELKVNLR